MAGGARSYRLPGVAAGSGAGPARHRRHSGWPGTGRARSRRPVRIPPADLAFREGIQRDRPQQNARRAREQLSPNARPASMTFWRGPSGSRKDRIMPTGKSSMQGKICMVTGANSGIGKATALALAQMGATVVMVCRDRTRGEQARGEITTKSKNNAVDLLLADLSSQQSIRHLVENVQRHYTHLHVLINNAGATFPGRRETVDGLEMTFAVNYLAPFLLTNLLLDMLKASAPARIVNVSSAAHTSGSIQLGDLQAEKRYRPMRTYPQAKLAVVLFTYELARRLKGTGVTANCLHPGFVATNFAQSDGEPAVRLLVKLIGSFGTSPEKGAKTSIYLASSPEVEGVTGTYFVKSIPRRSAAISYDESQRATIMGAERKASERVGKSLGETAPLLIAESCNGAA